MALVKRQLDVSLQSKHFAITTVLVAPTTFFTSLFASIKLFDLQDLHCSNFFYHLVLKLFFSFLPVFIVFE